MIPAETAGRAKLRVMVVMAVAISESPCGGDGFGSCRFLLALR
jgi:hypothetical protein